MADEHASVDDLYLYAVGEISEFERASIETHVDTCEECALSVVIYREARDLEVLASAVTAKKQDSWLKVLASGAVGIVAGLAEPFQPKLHFPRTPVGPAFAADNHHRGSDSSHDFVRDEAVYMSSHSKGDDKTGGVKDMASGWKGFDEAQKQFGVEPDPRTSAEVQQTHEDTCAIQCQRLILDRFGRHTSEETLVREAEVRGLYHAGSGTLPADLGKLLEAHGIPVHRELHANVFNLSNELAQGHQVMVGVDAGALWHQNTLVQSMLNELGLGTANHAVIVSGIDTRDPDHIKVNITDPGTGHVAKQYDVNQFLNAWHASAFCMVSTTDPVPAYHPEMTNFDYHAGHIPKVGDASYEFIHEVNNTMHQESNVTLHKDMERFFFDVVSGKTSLDAMRHGFGGALYSVHDIIARAVASFSRGDIEHEPHNNLHGYQDKPHLNTTHTNPNSHPLWHIGEGFSRDSNDPLNEHRIGDRQHDTRLTEHDDAHTSQDWHDHNDHDLDDTGHNQ